MWFCRLNIFLMQTAMVDIEGDQMELGERLSPVKSEMAEEKVNAAAANKRLASSDANRSSPPKKMRLQLDAPSSSTSETSSKNKIDPRKYIYGNYNRYYGYRNQNDAEDIRLTAFKQHPEFFVNQTVLDIGCNYGALTLAIARELGVKAITGLDIDRSLIAMARKRLLEAEKAFRGDKSKCDALQHENNNRYDGFPFNVTFHHSNYVLEDERLLRLVKEEFDTILCLSVTKWVHLNFGDAGLKFAFKRMYGQLKSGGRLILEAQPWKGYKRRKKLTPDIFKHYQEIKLFPNKFEEYLLSDEVGFSECYNLQVPLHNAKGFQRPIQVFVKAATPANGDNIVEQK